MPTQKLLLFPIPTAGSQPPIGPQPALANYYVERQAWEPPPPQPTQKLLLFPIPTAGSQPPPYSIVLPTEIRRLWEPADPQPYLPIRSILPGWSVDNPPISTPYAQAVLLAWRIPDPMPTQKLLLFPTPTAGNQPPPYSIVVQTEVRRLWEPPDPAPRQQPPYVPIPAQGSQPIPSSLYAQAIPQWQPPFVLPQTLPGNASWNVPPILAVIPYAPLPASIVASWQPPWVQPPALVEIAPLTLTYGQQPPPYSVVLPIELRQAWEPPPPQPWQLPPFQPIPTPGSQPPPYSIVLQMETRQLWEPPPPMPNQLPLTVAPLTLAYGQQPIPTSLYMQAIPQWQPPPPMPLQIPPPWAPIPAQGSQPPPRTLYDFAVPQWQPPFVLPPPLPGNASWNVPPLIPVYVPYTTLPPWVISSWIPPWIMPQTLPGVAAWTPPPDARRKHVFLGRVPDVESRLRHFTEIVADLFNSLSGQGIIRQTAASTYSLIPGGYVATRPPGQTDDLLAGFLPGSAWIDTTGGGIYFCVSNAVGAAIWRGPL